MKKIGLIIKLQCIIILYSISSIAAKMASGCQTFSKEFFLWYGLELLCLGWYALFWQQMIKKIELSQAYTNRSMALVWSMLWSHFVFQEQISMKNMVGAVFVMLGIVMINYENGKGETGDVQ